MTKQLCFLILFIGFLNESLSQELRQMKIVGKPEKLTAEIASRKDIDGNMAAAIQVVSDMDGYSYDAFNGIVGNVDSRPGMDIVYLQTTERVLEIYKTGFEPLRVILSETGIRLQARDVWKLTLTGELIQEMQSVVIRYTPENADLYLDGELMPKAGIYPLVLGTHELGIAKEGYQPIAEQIVVDEQHILFEYTLERQPDALVEISTTPEGAKVYLDEIQLGETPVAVYYKIGQYALKIIKEGFISIENELIDIQLPSIRKEYTLEENVGYLTINTFENAQVSINGKVTSVLRNIKLAPQVVQIIVSMSKAKPIEEQVVLNRNEKLSIDLYPEVQNGSVQLAVTPFDADILLEGDAGEQFTSKGSKVFETIPVGKYLLTVRAEGFDVWRESVLVTKEERISKSISLAESPAMPTVIDRENLKIGQKAFGGIVFYLDGSGGGLVVTEQEIGKTDWGCKGISIMKTHSSLGAGNENTKLIVKRCINQESAAGICENYEGYGYDDWYLPSKDELNLFYTSLKQKGMGLKAFTYYWSSSEKDAANAWIQSFSSGEQYSTSKSKSGNVVAVRKF